MSNDEVIIRHATADDVEEVKRLIQPFVEQRMLLPRPDEELAALMQKSAGFQVLVIPPPPEPDDSGLRDQPGVIADVAAALRDESISVEAMLQHGRADGEGAPVPVVITTHETEEAAMRRALTTIAGCEPVLEPPCVIRIETL